MSIKELGYKMCVGDVSLPSKQESRQLSYFFSNSFFVANIRTYLFEQRCNIIKCTHIILQWNSYVNLTCPKTM